MNVIPMNEDASDKETWMWAVRLYGNKFSKDFFLCQRPPFLPAAVRWLTVSKAYRNTLHRTALAKLQWIMIKQKVWQTQIKLSCLLWWIISRCEGCFSYCTTRKKQRMVSPEGRKTSADISNKHQQRWEKGKRHVRQLALTWKQFFLRTQFLLSLHLRI